MDREDRYPKVQEFILSKLKEMQAEGEAEPDAHVFEDVALLGPNAILDSRSLVELLLAVEVFVADEFNAEFDWSSDRAMSGESSPFRTPSALAKFAVSGMGEQ